MAIVINLYITYGSLCAIKAELSIDGQNIYYRDL
jgi:hypothetical protein